MSDESTQPAAGEAEEAAPASVDAATAIHTATGAGEPAPDFLDPPQAVPPEDYAAAAEPPPPPPPPRLRSP